MLKTFQASENRNVVLMTKHIMYVYILKILIHNKFNILVGQILTLH
jgi:hypothetical protein